MQPSCWGWNWAASTVSLLHWDSSWRAERCQSHTTSQCSVQSSTETRKLPPSVLTSVLYIQSEPENKREYFYHPNEKEKIYQK